MFGIRVNQIVNSEINSAHVIRVNAVCSTHRLHCPLDLSQFGAPVPRVGVRVYFISVQGRVMFRTLAHEFGGVCVGRGWFDLHGRFNFDCVHVAQKVLIFNIFHVKISFKSRKIDIIQNTDFIRWGACGKKKGTPNRRPPSNRRSSYF